MRARERGVATQIDLDGRWTSTDRKRDPIAAAGSGIRQVQLPGSLLHPRAGHRPRQHYDCCRIGPPGFRGEGIDTDEADRALAHL
jgi:hypothetical protein